MKPTIYVVQVRVYTDEMIQFFKSDPAYGTKEKPYPADSFSEIVSPYAMFYGPLRNIILFNNNCVYQWKLESADGRPLTFSSNDDGPEMDMVMITDQPSDKKWKKVFKNAPAMQPDGKIKLKSKNSNNNVFELETTDDVNGGGCLKYSFLFEFDNNGKTCYAIIDPLGSVIPPPPPPAP